MKGKTIEGSTERYILINTSPPIAMMKQLVMDTMFDECRKVGTTSRRQVGIKKVLGADGNVNRWRQSILSNAHHAFRQSEHIRINFIPERPCTSTSIYVNVAYSHRMQYLHASHARSCTLLRSSNYNFAAFFLSCPPLACHPNSSF